MKCGSLMALQVDKCFEKTVRLGTKEYVYISIVIPTAWVINLTHAM